MTFQSSSHMSKYFLRDYATKAVMVFVKITCYLEDMMFMHESSPGISLVFI